jgi:quinol monooxygenase YgiN
MLTVVVVASVKPGHEQIFETGIARLFESIAAEPGCRGATWGRTEKLGEYALIERYADQAALEAHRASAHMKEQGPSISALLAGAPVIVRFTEHRSLGPTG